MEEKLGNEPQEMTYDLDSETGQSMKEIDNEPLEETDEENVLRPGSPLRRKQERYEEKTRQIPENNQEPKSNQGDTTIQI